MGSRFVARKFSCFKNNKNRTLIFLINYFTNQIYKFNDILIAQSKSFQKILIKRSNKRVLYIPNYAEIFNKKIIKTNKKFTIVYAGNIGKAQSLITLLKSAKKLKEKDKVDIRIYGDGFELDKLKNTKKKITLSM